MYVHRGVCTGTCENAIIDSPTDENVWDTQLLYVLCDLQV